nr:MAG TPA: Protein of unknown function (DUF4231) [Caudoviricetes sp.]
MLFFRKNKNKPIQEKISESDYLNSRLNEQIEYFDKKSISMKKKYFSFEIISIILSSAIPIVTLINPSPPSYYDIAIAILGTCTTIISSIVSLKSYNNEWLQCRSVCENLKHHKYLFINNCEPYNLDDNITNKTLLVNNCEKIILSDLSDWKTYSSSNN